MISLYESGGSRQIELISPSMGPEAWGKVRTAAFRLLVARGHARAAELLDAPYELWAGTNDFRDDFYVLYAELSLDPYLVIAGKERDPILRADFKLIAKALEEVGHEVRFIAVELSKDVEPGVVPAPALATTSETLERALADVERAMVGGRPADGVDRVHTALHAYLRGLVDSAGLVPGGDGGIGDLLRTLRKSHPALRPTGPRADDLTRVLHALGTIVHALNPIRNQASLAHPAGEVLSGPEAMLVINSARTLLHYLESKVRLPSP